MENHNINNYYQRMIDTYPGITQTELWKYLESDKAGLFYAMDISRVCFDACVASETITELLPNFTKHDSTHIKCVIEWMAILLDGKIDILTKEEAAMLIMIACCHDVGMSLSKENKERLLDELKTERLGQDLNKFFLDNKEIDDEYRNRDKNDSNDDLYNRIIRSFVRQRHHLRVEEELGKESFDGLKGKLRKDLIISLCKSHGEELREINKLVDNTGIRIYLLAILLRLSDIINYDYKRSPSFKFCHSGMNNPQNNEERISANEHIKNQICTWTINNDSLVCTGECPNNQILHDISNYVEWVRKEVEVSNNLLNEINSQENPLVIQRVKPELSGAFVIDDFRININTKRIIELLGSENIYGKKEAFLTELIQNSVDAILVRSNTDSNFDITEGKIDIYLWGDNQYVYVRVDDNGFGMDKEILKSYFLTVGESYYKSYEFKKIQREGHNDFTPINRFGIGILSCFMNKKDASMEIETRNIYDENVYRMDITSLDGYYSLYKEDRKDNVIPVSSPSFKTSIIEGYNRDYGTSICVKHLSEDINNDLESFKNYIFAKIHFPIMDFRVHTSDKTYSLFKKVDFLNKIEKIMNGKKYKSILDILEIFYFDSIDDYFQRLSESRLGKTKLRSELLSNVKYILVCINDKYVIEYNEDYKNSVSRLFEELKLINTDFLCEEEKYIIDVFLSSMRGRAKRIISYNGVSIIDHSPFFADEFLNFCFVNRHWVEKVNLTKTTWMDTENEIEYFRDITYFLSSNNLQKTKYLPRESFEAIEQRLIECKYVSLKDNKVFVEKVNNNKYRRMIMKNLGILSLAYNIFFDISKDKIFSAEYKANEQISEKEKIFRINMGVYFGYFNDCNVIFYCDWVNCNHPIIKWILENYEELSTNYREVIYNFSKELRLIVLHKNDDSRMSFRNLALFLTNNTCELLDNKTKEFLQNLSFEKIKVIRDY